MEEMTFSRADLEYIRRGFATLETACRDRRETVEDVRRLIADGRLPHPSYILDDGTEIVPEDYFQLVGDAGSVELLKGHFLARYDAAGGSAASRTEDWEGYLSGLYGVCLCEVTPETIVRKAGLVEEIERLLDSAQPGSRDWRRSLRSCVDDLDRLEREFSPDYDRSGRFPQPPTRDRLIRAPRARCPDVFTAAELANR
jgi:hypothetical protein